MKKPVIKKDFITKPTLVTLSLPLYISKNAVKQLCASLGIRRDRVLFKFTKSGTTLSFYKEYSTYTEDKDVFECANIPLGFLDVEYTSNLTVSNTYNITAYHIVTVRQAIRFNNANENYKITRLIYDGLRTYVMFDVFDTTLLTSVCKSLSQSIDKVVTPNIY